MEKIFDIFLTVMFISSIVFSVLGFSQSKYYFILAFYFLNIFTFVLLFSIHKDNTKNHLSFIDFLCCATFSIAIFAAIYSHLISKTFCLFACVMFIITTLTQTLITLKDEQQTKIK